MVSHVYNVSILILEEKINFDAERVCGKCSLSIFLFSVIYFSSMYLPIILSSFLSVPYDRTIFKKSSVVTI